MKNTKKETIKIIKQMDKAGEINIHNLGDTDIETINQYLNEDCLINYTIDCIETDDYYLQVTYYSEKIGKTIIWDYDFEYNSDGETPELMAESILQLEKDIQEFESRLSINGNK